MTDHTEMALELGRLLREQGQQPGGVDENGWPVGEEMGVVGQAADFQRAHAPRVSPTTDPDQRQEAQPEAQGAPEPTGDDREQLIPRQRFDQLNDRMKVAESSQKELQEENQRLKQELQEWKQRQQLEDAITPSEYPKGYEDWSHDEQETWRLTRLAEALRSNSQPQQASVGEDILERMERLELRLTFGGLNEDQADALLGIKKSSKLTSNAEIMLLARARHPELFGSGEGSPPPSHQVLAPGRSGPKTPPKKQTAQDIAAQLQEEGRGSTLGPDLLVQMAKDNPDLLFKGR